jgi:hypothetical protein
MGTRLKAVPLLRFICLAAEILIHRARRSKTPDGYTRAACPGGCDLIRFAAGCSLDPTKSTQWKRPAPLVIPSEGRDLQFFP